MYSEHTLHSTALHCVSALYIIIWLYIIIIIMYNVCVLLLVLCCSSDLTVKTSLFSRVGGGSEDRQTNIISFKKTHYAGTLVASFQPTSDLRHLSLQVRVHDWEL